MEVPLEYRSLGTLLRSERKREAEDGSSYITTRELGPSFSNDLPAISNLTCAYRLREPEIVENLRFNPRFSSLYHFKHVE